MLDGFEFGKLINYNSSKLVFLDNKLDRKDKLTVINEVRAKFTMPHFVYLLTL